jgi:hypothetical protein
LEFLKKARLGEDN